MGCVLLILPVIVILIIFLVEYCDFLFSHYAREFFYSVSLSIEELVLFVLPIIVFSLIFQSIANLGANRALKMVFISVFAICFSNLISSISAYFFGMKILSINILKLDIAYDNTVHVAKLWNIELPKLISNGRAIILGFTFGLLVSFLGLKRLASLINVISDTSMFFLQRLFKPLIPLFIFGFILKMKNEGLSIFRGDYFLFMCLIFVITYSYIILLYVLGNWFSIRKCLSSILNMLPAGLVAFSSMSSIAAMPTTLLSTEKNTDKKISRFIIPISVNIHLIGDCFFILILSFSMSNLHFGHMINSYEVAVFIGHFILSKFAIAAVPGGGIIVVLPLLEQYLHFTPGMMSIITALYMLFDPLITSANVMGNGAFAIIFSRIFKKAKL